MTIRAMMIALAALSDEEERQLELDAEAVGQCFVGFVPSIDGRVVASVVNPLCVAKEPPKINRARPTESTGQKQCDPVDQKP
jgi:hypothetical protein